MKIAALFAGLAMLAGMGQAQVVNRQVQQQKRIKRGVATEQLTKEEAAKLERKEAATNRQIERDRVDGGRMTASERAKANRQLNRNSKQIYKEKHDEQKRQ